MGSNKWARHTFVWVLLILASIFIWFTFISDRNTPAQIDGKQLADDIHANKVTRIVTTTGSNEIQVEYVGTGKDNIKPFRLADGVTIYELLEAYNVDPATVNVKIETKAASQWGSLLGTLTFLLPTLFLVGIFIFMMRQAQGSNNQAISFGKSRARMFTGNRPTVTFADVAGVEEAKQELQEVVEFLKYPDKFAALGARIPRGVLLVGPPGTGKTLLSRAVAGEAGVPFFSISGSEFVEMFVGVGACRVRDLFDQAKRNAPCIIFIDEIDAVGRQRGAGLGGSHDEREQTLNQILVEMDGFDSQHQYHHHRRHQPARTCSTRRCCAPAASTARSSSIARTSRGGRRSSMSTHAASRSTRHATPNRWRKQTPGFSGADLENLVNEAAILAARRNKKTIGKSEMEEAIDRVHAGPRAQEPRDQPAREDHDGLPRGRPRASRRACCPHADPVAQGLDRRARHDGRLHPLSCPRRTASTIPVVAVPAIMLVCMLGGHVAERLVFDELSHRGLERHRARHGVWRGGWSPSSA